MGSSLSIKHQDRVDEIIGSFPVRLALIYNTDHVFVAYYNSKHQLCVAKRLRSGGAWQRHELPTQIGWDSHNYVTMAFDADGYIHLSANMHVVPLIYFISDHPGEIDAWTQQDQLIGSQEDQCTYPEFLKSADGRLVFHYRDGYSGNGCEIYNIYNHQDKSWQRLLEQALHDGLGQMSAYAHGPIAGPDGYFHVCWVWRDNPDADTNHDVSYIASPDLVNWYNAAGEQQSLPITPDNTHCIVDPVPVQGGCINGNVLMGFDSDNKIFVTYHKFDKDGITQVYIAQFNGQQWNTAPITDWNHRWAFGGRGSLEFDIRLSDPIVDNNNVIIPYTHKDYPGGLLCLDHQTLSLIEDQRDAHVYPDELYHVQSTLADMRVHVQGSFPSPYVLRWETLPNNRDKKPENTTLTSTLTLIECE